MKKYLQIEYLKLKGNSSFKVFTLFFIIFLPILVYVSPFIIEDSILGKGTYPYLPKSSQATWYFTTYIASWFSLFILSFIIIFHITNEYAAKTVRQNIIDGYSKLDFLKSKFYMVFFMAFVATIYVFVVGLIANFYFGSTQPDLSNVPNVPGMTVNIEGDFSNPFNGILFLLSYFLQVLAYFVLAVLTSVLIKKGALVVIVYFSLFFIEIIIGIQLKQGLENVVPYLPLHSFSSLLPFAGWESLLKGLGEVEPMTLTNSIVTITYILIFILLTKVIFFKRDVV